MSPEVNEAPNVKRRRSERASAGWREMKPPRFPPVMDVRGVGMVLGT
jgi:hypothetical protein